MINFTDEEETEIEKAFIALKQALAEKEHELQQIREHEFQNGYREAEAIWGKKYQQLMAQAVGLAETVLQGHRHRLKTLRIVRANASITLADKFLNSTEAQAFLKEHQS